MSAKPKRTPGPVRCAIIRVGEAYRNLLKAQAAMRTEDTCLETTKRCIFKNEAEQAFHLGLAVVDFDQAKETCRIAEAELSHALDSYRKISAKKGAR